MPGVVAGWRPRSPSARAGPCGVRRAASRSGQHVLQPARASGELPCPHPSSAAAVGRVPRARGAGAPSPELCGARSTPSPVHWDSELVQTGERQAGSWQWVNAGSPCTLMAVSSQLHVCGWGAAFSGRLVSLF